LDTKDIVKLFFFLSLILFSCKNDDNIIVDEPSENLVNKEFKCVNCEDSIFIFRINTLGSEIVDEPKIPSSLTVLLGDSIQYAGNIGIEIRGETSQYFDKKSYGIETWDNNYNDFDFDLAWLPEEEDWILYGPYSDKSLIRNKIIYEVSNSIGMYASRTRYVELFINYSYKGLYILMEKLKRDKNRINIKKLENGDIENELISGGYIIKIDKSDMDDGSYSDFNSFNSNYDINGNLDGDKKIIFNYEYPKPGDINSYQKNYIIDYINEFEKSLSSSNFSDLNNGFRKFIDEKSFIDFFILNELSNNVDGYRLSTYLHKERNEKLKIGPIWDFNLSFGNADYCGGNQFDVWTFEFNERCPGDFWLIPFWWKKLLEDEVFVSNLKTRWFELRSNILSDQSLENMVNNKFDLLYNKTEAAKRNFIKWEILENYIWPNSFVGGTYINEIEFLKNWIENRTEWLDNEIEKL
tara:strand:- start:3789 stop:5186 length:1398 start_codon:yes stop_codon:yes gene_type:complete